MNAKEFKETRNWISVLTPAQKRRLAADLQESARGNELPEQVRSGKPNWIVSAYAGIVERKGSSVTGSRQARAGFDAARRLVDGPSIP